VLGGVVERDEAAIAAHAVDRPKAPGRDKPPDRVRRNAFERPALRCRDECVMQRVLGEIEAAEQPHERREHASALLAVDRVNHVIHRHRA